MILPKGTVEFTFKGGEDSTRDPFSKIQNERLTGYILVTTNNNGRLLFLDGEVKIS